MERTNVRNSLAIAVACFVLNGFPSYASDPRVPTDETPVTFTLTGTRSAGGASTNIRLQVESGTVYALRVYSEPSGTLISAFADNHSGDPQSASWWREIFPSAVSIAVGPLVGNSKVLQQGAMPPAGDKKLAIKVYGLWGNETTPRDRVLRVTTDPGDFSFKLTQYSVTGRICCLLGQDQCGGGCKFCGLSEEYRCCKWYTGSGCGWCNEVRPECTGEPCPEC